MFGNDFDDITPKQKKKAVPGLKNRLNPYDVKEFLKEKANLAQESDFNVRKMCVTAKKEKKWDTFGLSWDEFDVLYRLLKEMQSFVRYERVKLKIGKQK